MVNGVGGEMCTERERERERERGGGGGNSLQSSFCDSDMSRQTLDLFFLFLFLFTPVLSQCDFSHGKFWLISPGKASCDRVALPNLRCMLGVLVCP